MDKEKETCQSIDGSKLADIHMLLYINEKFQISDKTWQELSIRSGKLPSKYSLKQRVCELNKLWNVFETPGDQPGVETPGDQPGVQMSSRESLTGQITKLQKSCTFVGIETLKIEISGDGARVGKRLQLLNVSYTIINERAVAATLQGNHIIAIVKAKDNYANIRDSQKDLNEVMRNLWKICVNGVNYKIELFLGGDWKFLATVCGIGPANHNFASIWCSCPKPQRWDVSKTWSIERTI